MNRILSIPALALVAVFAMGAVFASVAQAENTPTFTATGSPVRETGTQVGAHKISVNAGTIECAEANLLGAGGAMMVVLQPSYGECSGTVNLNGCEYTFEALKTIEEDKYTGRMGILCPAGQAIEISTTGCKITIPEQVNLETVEFTNDTGAKPVEDEETWKTEITKGEYMQTGAFCKGGNGIYTNMTYSGNITVRGENPNTLEPIGLWIGD